MSYATVAQLRKYLPQAATGTAADAELQTALDTATDIVDLALGFSFAEAGVAADRDVQCPGNGQLFELPAHVDGSVDAVYHVAARGADDEGLTEITGFINENGGLFRAAGWLNGEWYRVTAQWGTGAAPASIVEVTLELAVNVYRGKDRGMFTDVIGVEGAGSVAYARALTNQQRMIIDAVRLRTLGVVHA